MASRSVSAVLVLGFLVVAAFCVAEANATEPQVDDLLKAMVKITLHNKCGVDVRLKVSLGKVLDCKKGKVAVLAPVKVKLEPLYKLKLMLFVFDHHGKPLKITAVAYVNLHKLGKLIKGVTELVLHLEEVKVAEGKLIKLLCGNTLLTKLVVKG